MRTDQPVTVKREDYTPPTHSIDRVNLRFELDPHRTLVHAELSVRRNPTAGSADLVLNGAALKLVDLRLDGVQLGADRYESSADRLCIRQTPPNFELSIVTELDPTANTALSGLYASNGNLFTQCEAEGFRRITYFLDRPDVMARYRVRIEAERAQFPTLLSNGNLVESGPLGQNRHYALWDDPFPKPSYLFALVAGRFAVRECQERLRSGRQALLQVWVEPGNEDKTDYALASLIRAIHWDEERFGLELDLDRFMIVATADFNMGAMENKGLNIFNTKYVFAHPRIATDADFTNVESVVGHEYFHNWTGNRITCRDWFQLTLKEGLTVFRDQEFSADMLAQASASPAAAASARAVKRIEDVRTLRTAQFPEDAGPMRHPIRPDSYQEINNFYTVTVYEKGAEVVRMLQTLVGVEGFRRGMALYFERHDGQAVTCEAFVDAIGDANRRDLAQFKRWYGRAGTPIVIARGSYDAAARCYRLQLRQSMLSPTDAGAPLHIPFALGLIGADGRDVPLRLAGEPATSAVPTRVFELTSADTLLEFIDVPGPVVPSLARNFSAPIIVDYPYNDSELATLIHADSDPFNRWEAAQRLAVAAVLGQMRGAADSTERLIDAFGRLLREPALDNAFKEQVLLLPSEGYIAEQLEQVDPQAVRDARNAVRRRVGQSLRADWQRMVHELDDRQPWRADVAAAGRRALRAVALGYWNAGGDRQAIDHAEQLFLRTDNMTDRLAALSALLLDASKARDQALQQFEAMFADESLALDKWFQLQATMHRGAGDPPVLERVKALMRHRAFSMRNPNKVRALIGAFCNGNLAEFHSPDGSGYAFWAEQVRALDATNPQIAARIARALDRWRKFTPALQQRMRAALESVATVKTLSADVHEIVTKALQS